MKNINITAWLFIQVIVIQGAIAQCRQVKWPDQRSVAEEKVALYGDALKQGKYRAAGNAIQWMLVNAPDWHIKLYVDAAKIYDKLAEAEKDPAKKEALVDSLLWIHDQRMKNCGSPVKVLNKKAFVAYKYRIQQKDKVAALLRLYDSLVEVSDGKLTDSNLVAYMTVVQGNHVMLKNLDNDDIMSRYDRVINILEDKLKEKRAAGKTKGVEKLERYKGIIDDLLVSMVEVDCDFIKQSLAPKFRENPNDVALAKKIFGFMLQGKCTEDPLWLETGELILKEEKDFGLLKNIALKHFQQGSLAKAEKMFMDGLQVAQSPSEKADMLILLGGIEVKRGNKSQARQYFRKASATSSSEKRGYEKIGDLYYGSFEACAKKENRAEDRLVYIAAYNMYQRAGDARKMAQAKAQFPSKEEIFLLNWKVGDSVQVGCWIGETVTLDTRD